MATCGGLIQEDVAILDVPVGNLKCKLLITFELRTQLSASLPSKPYLEIFQPRERVPPGARGGGVARLRPALLAPPRHARPKGCNGWYTIHS